jgi:hypothetical protein
VLRAEVSLIYEVIPLIDKFTEKFEQIIMNASLDSSLQNAAKIALLLLNKYYLFTDDCDANHVSICMFLSLFIVRG